MTVGEGGDELRDGVVWIYLLQHLLLLNPSKLVVFCCQLYPYGIDNIFGHHTNVGNHHALASFHGKRIDLHSRQQFFRLLTHEDNGVGTYYKIEILGVMVLMQEVEGVLLNGRQRIGNHHRITELEMRRGAVAIATAHQQYTCQQGEEDSTIPHR